MYQDPVWWVCLGIVFTPKRCQFLNTLADIDVFQLNARPKRYRISSRCRPFEGDHSKRYHTFFFNL